MAFIEPCFGIGHNLSLICQMTSEDIKHQLIIIIDNGGGGSHACPSLDCLKRWHWDHTCHHSHRFSELATKSGMENPDCHIPMFEIHHQWKFCSGHTGVKGSDRADRLAGESNRHTSGLRLGRSEVLRSLRHYVRAQSQGHHTVDRPEDRERRGKRKR